MLLLAECDGLAIRGVFERVDLFELPPYR